MPKRHVVPLLLAAVVGGCAAILPVFADGASATSTPSRTARSCSTAPAGYATCDAIRRTDVRGPLARPNAIVPNVAGFGPADLRSAYKFPSTTHGAGHTV